MVRNHPSVISFDVLRSIDTRFSVLTMTYTKYINIGVCCFIPGKVIDEVLDVLGTISNANAGNSLAERPLHGYEVLDDLRGKLRKICNVATDHFKNEIEPSLLLTKAHLDSTNTSVPALDSFFQTKSKTQSIQRLAKRVNPYQINYVRMQRELEKVMRKVK